MALVLASWLLAALAAYPAAAAAGVGVPLFSPRVLGMGGAGIAAAGPEAIAYDPTGLAGTSFEAVFAGAAAARDLSGNLAALFRDLHDTFEGTGPPPPAQGQADALAAVAINGSGAALWVNADADFQGSPSQGTGRLTSAMALATAWPQRLGRARLTLASAFKFLYLRTISATGAEATREQARGFGLDVAARWHVASWVSLAAVARDVAGTLAWAPLQGGGGERTEQWLFTGARWAAGAAFHPPSGAVRGVLEARWDGGWSVGIEQRLFGGGVALRLGRLTDPRAGSFNTVGVGLAVGPLVADAAFGIPVDAGPYLAATSLGFRF